MIFNQLGYGLTSPPSKQLLLSLLLLSSSIISFILHAQPRTPVKNEVVAKWEPSNLGEEKTLKSAAKHLYQGQFPGQANIQHAMANTILQHVKNVEQGNSEYWYLLARSLQHQHRFTHALDALSTALEITPNYPSAWLLKANIHMTQSDFDLAKFACTQLIGNTEFVTAATCSLEVESYKGKLEESYSQLSTLLKRLSSSEYSQSQVLWQLQVLADMASRLGLFAEAEQWLALPLKNTLLADMPLSFIALWSDIQYRLGKNATIIEQLDEVFANTSFKDDALLVRIAMAEKELSAMKLDNPNNKSNSWSKQITNRVNLRILRNDFYHAADIARFFIYIEPSSKQALKWAEINYKQAKLFDDLSLLQIAQKMNQAQSSTGNDYASE